MIIEKEFPELNYFLGCYFYQEWAAVINWKGQEPTFEAIVRNFAVIENKQLVKQANGELKTFLSRSYTDNEIEKILVNQSQVVFNPVRRGMTYRQWLEQILMILEESPNSKNLLEYKRGTSPEAIGLDLDALGFPRINQK